MPSDANLIGMPKEEIDTPALVIDLDAFEANIAKMAQFFENRRTNLRPHFKTHKSPIIARKQLEAGAVGITCAKVGEAECLIDGGVTANILIANQIVTKEKIAKLMGLARHADITVCVDNQENIQDLSEAAQLFGTEVGVLVEVNVGMDRCGVDSPEEAWALARAVAAAKGLRFRGLQGYEGHLVLSQPDFNARREATYRDLEVLLRSRELIEKNGIPVELVDSAGTGTYSITGDIPWVDEIQAGSYVFMDANYLRITPEFLPALTLLTTIISRPKKDLAVTDMGMKAASIDQVMPTPMRREGVTVKKFSEEHSSLELSGDAQDLKMGEKIELIPGHGCTTINLHDRYYGIRNGKVEVIWDIPGRGKFR
jgi:D-serine deaminase-like pyridoxal phosphate-dependent protein